MAKRPRFRLTAPVVREPVLHRQIADALRLELGPPGKPSPDGVTWFSVDMAAYAGAVPGIRTGRGCIAGLPDIHVCWNGGAFLIEVKAEDGRLSPAQQMFFATATYCGVPVGVARSPEEALALLDHFAEQDLLPRIDRLVAEIGLGGFQDLPGEVDRDLVGEREGADRHAGHAPDVLDHRGRDALGEHQVAFADIIEHAAIGVEAARIVDDDRRLADGAHIVDRGGKRRVGGPLADDDLDQHHPLNRREKMHADELRRPLR